MLQLYHMHAHMPALTSRRAPRPPQGAGGYELPKIRELLQADFGTWGELKSLYIVHHKTIAFIRWAPGVGDEQAKGSMQHARVMAGGSGFSSCVWCGTRAPWMACPDSAYAVWLCLRLWRGRAQVRVAQRGRVCQGGDAQAGAAGVDAGGCVLCALHSRIHRLVPRAPGSTCPGAHAPAGCSIEVHSTAAPERFNSYRPPGGPRCRPRCSR